MASKAPLMHCHFCGDRFGSDKVVDHERRCQQQNDSGKGVRSDNEEDEDLAALRNLSSGVDEVRETTTKRYESSPGENYTKVETKTKSSRSKVKESDSPFDDFDNTGKSYEKEFTSEIRKSNRGQENNAASNQNGFSEIRKTTESRTVSPDGTETIERRKIKPDGTEVVETTTTTRTESNDRNVKKCKEPTSLKESKAGESGVSSKKETTRKEYTSRRVEKSGHGSSESDFGKSSDQSKSKNNQDNESTTLDKDKQEENNGKGTKNYSQSSSPKNNKGKGSTSFLESQRKSDKKEKFDIGKEPYPTSSANSSPNTKTPKTNSHERSHKFLENLPELNPKDEAAYRSHKKSLVPCAHCDRTFSPGRVDVHERSCIKRPKEREYITPDK